MRVRLKGINSKTKTLSDGTKRTYWYAWKGGPRIEGEPGTPQFMASYNAAVSAKAKPAQGVILTVMQEFQASDAFLSLADSTKRDYVRYIKLIETEFGDFPLSALTDRRTRGELMAWRDTLALRSRRQADYAWSVLARILSWSLDRGRIWPIRANGAGASTVPHAPTRCGQTMTRPGSWPARLGICTCR